MVTCGDSLFDDQRLTLNARPERQCAREEGGAERLPPLVDSTPPVALPSPADGDQGQS
jgi:hypothetical protein